MRWVMLALGILLATTVSNRAQAQGSDWVIIEEGSPPAPAPAAPAQFAPSQGKLIVTVAPPPEPVQNVRIFVDDVAVGGPPSWQGVVAPGAHKVRAEGVGWISRGYKVTVAPNQSSTVSVELLRGGEFDLGMWYVGLVYSFGVGGSYSGGDKYRLNSPGLGPGLNAGLRLPLEKLWLEAGLVIGPWTDRWIDYDPDSWAKRSREEQLAMKERSGQGMPLSLSLRFVSAILKPFLYWSATFEPGVLLYKPYRYDEDDPQYGYVEALESSGTRAIFMMSLRAGIALFATDWFEIRVDPIGLGLHCTKPFGAVYTPSFALVLRL